MDVIEVHKLSKKYLLEHRKGQGNLRDALSDGARALPRALAKLFARGESREQGTVEDFWAVRDVNFRIGQGERVGIIGRNGAGKSTLLKLLSRITGPTEGRIELVGLVASLLEVGTGFHPDLTGRENIFLNGAILGMTRAETRRKFDEIVSFAEVEKFLDTPVKRYSSGMYVRLAFAVAAHLEPEILIVDEVLAVGDAQFQKKCLGKMEEVGREGRTVIFVSHNIGAIHSLTERCILLERGQIRFDGETRQAVEKYLTMSESATGAGTPSPSFYRPHYYHPENGPVRIEKIWFGGTGENANIDIGQDFSVFVQLEVRSTISGATLAIALINAEGQHVAVFFSRDQGFEVDLEPGTRVMRIDVRGLPLAPGRYFINVGINQSTETTAWDGVVYFPAFEVRNAARVVHWLHRPWGIVHWDAVEFAYDDAAEAES